jgi:hypothetical protein
MRTICLNALKGTLSILAAMLCLNMAWAEGRDGVAVEIGYGYHTDMGRINYNREWSEPLYTTGSLAIGGYWDFSLGYWHPHNPAGGNNDVVDLGITPVFRLTEKVRSNIAPYFEAAVGGHFISEHAIYTGRNMSTNFQFGDHVGIGVSLGDKHEWDVGLRLQHLSNAGIKNPNPGINFYQARVGYHF